uniref:Uncharacterized protein n=1 Tax=Gasterosteus aculeatus TaxID=69293 RepID=G3NEM8_GASAC
MNKMHFIVAVEYILQIVKLIVACPCFFFSQRNTPASFHRDSILPSETTLIGIYSGDALEESLHHQPPAERPESTTSPRRHDYDEVSETTDQWDRINPPVTGLNLGSNVRAQDKRPVSRQDTARERRVSMETVPTEVWLRPARRIP